jgi:ferredoxin-type protein NapF
MRRLASPTWSRRALLSGGAAADPTQAPEIGAACLAARDVLCRTCGDICAEGAIRFPPLRGRVALPVLDRERCTGCGDCIEACPMRAIGFRDAA